MSQRSKKILSLLKNRGFSLIELMVVVAIIAILSTIAIPSYQTFQAKARQKEGFALMGAYYSAAHASRTEYSFFPGNFVGTGFAPQGQLGYTLKAGENAAALPYGQIEDAACIITTAACNCGGMCANYKEWVDASGGAVGATVGSINPATAGVATANNFTIAVAGVPTTRGSKQDEYKMIETKAVTIVTDGLK